MKKYIAIIILIILGGVAFYFYKGSTNKGQTTNSVSVEQQVLENLKAQGLNCQNNSCSVSVIDGDYAKGNMYMAYWIAQKIGKGWKVIITGNGIPSCAEIDKYDVPQKIFGNCIESTGELRNK